METIIKKITNDLENDKLIISEAGRIIREGGLVAFPTETVYGLGGDAFSPDAAAKIYAAKGRPSDNPLIVHIAKVEDLKALSDEVPQAAYMLADKFWPGPLTIIVKKNDRVPMSVTGGLNTVAVRLPANTIARGIIEESQTFIAAPSANLSGRPSPTTGEHVIEDLSGRVDMIVDGGTIDIGLESTIVDLSETIPVVLRPGFITVEELREVIGEVVIDPAIKGTLKEDVAPKAPGMKYRHYAPKALLTIVKGEEKKVTDKLLQLLKEDVEKGLKVGIMTTVKHKDLFDKGEVICLGEADNNEEIARNLFWALRRFDELNVDVIYSEAFSEEGVGQAVMNRLNKAAGHRTILVK